MGTNTKPSIRYLDRAMIRMARALSSSNLRPTAAAQDQPKDRPVANINVSPIIPNTGLIAETYGQQATAVCVCTRCNVSWP
jgi:hypothetical protein